MENILITGGNIFAGMHLTNFLIAKGYEVSWLTRKIKSDFNTTQYLWNWENKSIELQAIEKADTIIHPSTAQKNKTNFTV